MKNTFSKEETRRLSFSIPVPEDTPVRQMIIGKPWVETHEDKAYQKCRISLGDVEREVYFSVPVDFEPYLTYERGDAYLIGLLSMAMRERCDIRSEAPLTGELMHQIQTELLPILTKYSPRLYWPKIQADIEDTPLPCAGKIGTGGSCGVDSMLAIKKLSESAYPCIHLDYIVLNNVGAYTWLGEASQKRAHDNAENAAKFAREFGYKLLVTDSNFSEAFPQSHLLTHAYSSTFAIYMLRKLWSRYYYASAGYDLEGSFNLTNHDEHDTAYYELVALPCLSISSLRISTESAAMTRFEKIKALADYKPAQKYLNVCLNQGAGNCGRCRKCMKTLWTLDAIGKLDNFQAIMPIRRYKQYYADYIRMLYFSHLKGLSMMDETYKILKHKISFLDKIKVLIKEWKYLSPILRKDMKHPWKLLKKLR